MGQTWAAQVAAAQAEAIEALDAAWEPWQRGREFILTRAGEPDTIKGTQYVMEFSGPDRDDVLRCARTFDLKGA
jgi:hypothetical protein